MSIDKRLGSKIPEFADKDRVAGVKRDPGPYIGIVKNNADPVRSGRLQVFITDFGGVETDQSHWITVSYASPYVGAARRPNLTGAPNKPSRPTDNEYDKVNHSYGLWLTPPDIGNQVLVTFVGGDTNNGYWFACILPDLSHYATPGQAGSDYLEEPRDPKLAEALKSPPYPCVEFNEDNLALRDKWTNFLEIPKPIHEHQARVLLKQGLEDDKVRGVISSSSQRESPSRVFGISTPGQEGSYRDPVTNAVGYRKGGHTFVMDDGTAEAKSKDQLVRLRTAGGHQLLMNDTEEVLYIGNANGKTWMEFTADGKVHVYAENDISFRSEKSINLHADKDINMFAHDNIKMYSGESIQEQSQNISLKAITELKEYGGKIGVLSGSTWAVRAGTAASIGSGTEIVHASGMIYLNTKDSIEVTTPPSIPVVEHPVPTLSGIKWKHTGTKLSSTIPLDPTPIPTHEPYVNHKTNPSSRSIVKTGNVVRTGSGGTVVDGSGNPVTSGDGTLQAGPASSINAGVKSAASVSDLSQQPISSIAIGAMTIADVTALKAQLAKSESNFNYSCQNSIGYIGKYQFGVAALETYGYMQPGTWATYKKNTAVNDPENWTGKDGITSKEAFFAARDIQESLMDRNLQSNYSSLITKGIIDTNSTSEDIAGKLAVAHLLGAGGCSKWCTGQGGADAYGTTGSEYYNAGRYAVNVLSPKVEQT